MSDIITAQTDRKNDSNTSVCYVFIAQTDRKEHSNISMSDLLIVQTDRQKKVQKFDVQ